MKPLLGTVFILLVWFICPSGALAQGPVPIRISVFNQATSLPFSRIWTSPMHPGIQVGADLWPIGKGPFTMQVGLGVSYFFHRELYHAFQIHANVLMDYRSDFGITVKTGISAGYMLSFRHREEYRFQDGAYLSSNPRIRSSFTPSLMLGLGYCFQPADPYSPEIFTLYQPWIQLPFAPDFIPVMTHTNIHLGTRFFLPQSPKD